MTEVTEPELLSITREELNAMINAAVDAKAEAIRAEITTEVETQLSGERAEQLGSAINESAVIRMDPGTGYEYALVNLDLIDNNPVSRRTPEELLPEDPGIQELIRQIVLRGGLTRPLLVYRQKGEAEGRYMLVKGHRRLAALRAMGQELVHAYILPAKPPLSMEERWVNGY